MSDKTKIAFVDIDGVLTTISTKWKTFHPDCVKALKRILDETDACMVLSSSWRHGFMDWRTEEGVMVSGKDALIVMRELFTDCGLPADRLLDKTPFLLGDHRGREIDKWLKLHPEVKSFVILDDDTDLDPHAARHVLTSWGDGLSESDADKAIEMLKSN